MLTELFTFGALGLLAVSFGVGIVVGLTGMGGGALMTPALIFLGIPPTAAVANDLVAAAVNKSVGAAVHYKHGSPNLRIALWLIIGSVPFAFAGAFIVDAFDAESQESTVKLAIGAALLVTAMAYSVRTYMLVSGRLPEGGGEDPPVRPALTVMVGAIGGLLVGLTSVGAGSLIMIALLMLYPRLAPVRLVGTDLVQAIPLVLAAAIGHVIVTGVDVAILIPLLIGGIPGTYLGARISGHVPQSIIRRGIAIVLTLTGLALVGVPPIWVGIIGATLLILGPVAWHAWRRFADDRWRPVNYGSSLDDVT